MTLETTIRPPEIERETQSLIAKPFAAVVRISPEDATSLLGQNDGNRRPNGDRVTHYVRLMKSGLWRLTGDAVCISPEGRLLNGQHRLMAVVEMGRAFPFVVLRNCPDESFAAMDSGMSRSPSVLFGKKGASQAADCAAIARMVWVWLEKGLDPGSDRGDNLPSPDELWTIYSQYREEIDAAAAVAKRLRAIYTVRGLGMAYVMTVLEHGEKAREFWSLVDPNCEAGLTKGHPARTLRDHMTLEPRARKMRPVEFVARAAQAFNYWIEGEQLMRSQYSAERGCPEIVKAAGSPMVSQEQSEVASHA